MVALVKPANSGYLDNCFGLGGLKIGVKGDVYMNMNNGLQDLKMGKSSLLIVRTLSKWLASNSFFTLSSSLSLRAARTTRQPAW